MAFEDVKDSIKWSAEGGEVFAYFTAHFAKGTDNQDKQEHDTVRYAIGYLDASGTALAGDLATVFANTDKNVFNTATPELLDTEGIGEGMEHRPNLSYRLEVHANGTIGVQPKINGKSIGGLPVEKLPGASVSPGLLRAASSTTAFTVSLDRQPKIAIPK